MVRVLVVEDQLKMASLMRRGLEREGYSVDVAGDGDEALWAAREHDYDAVVLDVMIPGPDGFEVCRTMRREGKWAPVIMLTARDAVDDRVLGLDAGADDYLVKPFAFAELYARLRALLRRDPIERPAVLQVGDLTLDPGTREVARAGVAVKLTAREFAVLEFLMRRPGAVLSRAAILERVWDYAYAGTSNVVDVYIKYLRDKVDRPFGVETIETVRGAGYRILAGQEHSPSPES